MLSIMETSLYLKTARVQLSLSQAGLGKTLGISRDKVANYENNRTPMPTEVYLKIEDILNNNENNQSSI